MSEMVMRKGYPGRARHVVAAALAGLVGLPGALAAQATDGPGPNLVLELGGAGDDGAGLPEGRVVIDLLPEVAPAHVAQITALVEAGAYDEVVFHRVIDGFMAQTGDVQFGRRDGDTSLAGMGGSDRPDLAAEFSDQPFTRGTVGMARAASPDSANSQFFIMFAPAPHLDGQYSVIGQVVEGMEIVDALKKGSARQNGLVTEPDYILRATIE